MRRLDKVLLVLVLILGAVTGPAEAQKVTGRLAVVDASGVLLGAAYGAPSNRASIYLRASGLFWKLVVSSNQLQGTASLHYESTDCTGEAYVRYYDDSMAHEIAVAPPGWTLYVPDLGAGPQSVELRSTLPSEGSCYEDLSPYEDELHPAVALTGDLQGGLTPPFRLVAAPE